MGICGSSELTAEQQRQLEEEKRRNRQAENAQAIREQADAKTCKLLLLGAGESGKSTLFKQMVMIYGTGGDMPLEERQNYIELIYSNVIVNARRLCENAPRFGMPRSPAGEEAMAFIEEELEDEEKLTPEIAAKLSAYWEDPGTQECYEQRSQFQLNDSTKYFFQRLDVISQPNWIPTADDVLRTRVRTTGIIEHSFEIQQTKFRMFDVGGQRNERKKWIHCFEDVTSLLFVAAISEFDQVLYEDEHTNRMSEALNLFHDIAVSSWFRDSSIILFLNKLDLFKEKIKTKDIRDSECKDLAAFEGDPRSEEDTVEFLEDLFRARAPQGKQIYVHATCATDTALVKKVFDDVKETIIMRSLEAAGLA